MPRPSDTRSVLADIANYMRSKIAEERAAAADLIADRGYAYACRVAPKGAPPPRSDDVPNQYAVRCTSLAQFDAVMRGAAHTN